MTCAKCAAPMEPAEKFCSACGASVAPDVPPPTPVFDALPSEAAQRIGKARKWLFAIAVLTVVLGFIFYAIQKKAVEKQIDDVRAQVAGLDPSAVDDHFVKATGMTFEEAIEHDRGMVTLLLVVNLVLAGVYFVLWLWAKRKPLPATVIALLLFVTTHVINAVLEPSTIYQGILIKILFTLALVRAIAAANEERTLHV